VIVGLLLLCFALAAAAQSGRGGEVDPVGIWNCLMYGPFGHQRFYLKLGPDRSTRTASVTEAVRRRWSPLSQWSESRGRLRFADEATEREFSADLGRPTLGGMWSAPARTGGWWCARIEGIDPADSEADRPPNVGGLMPTLVPAIMASPNYPRQAIREAKEGRAVSCFFVNGSGEISEPDVLEVSDEIFRAPTLAAVSRSSYQGRGDEHVLFPACRSFTFELQAVG